MEQADGWQILFYRGIAYTLTMGLVLSLKYRRGTPAAFMAIGRYGLLAGLALGFASVFYVFALISTSIANAMFIIGSAPLATALMAWLLLRERVPKASIAAMLVSLVGIGLMIADNLNSGRWLGNIMALCVVACFVVYLTCLRKGRDIDLLPASCIAGLVMVVVGFLGAEHLQIQRNDLLLCLLLGCVNLSVGFACYTIAARYILAAEVSLFALTESILAPIWVWWGVGEIPSKQTLAGCAIVLVAVTAYSVLEVLRDRQVPQPPAPGLR